MLESENNQIIASKSRLRWACRRGMLELDVLLNNFLEECFDRLSIEQRNDFIALLTYQDPEIFAWIMGHEMPVMPNIMTITKAIRDHAHSRFHT